ncbi:MAG: hypothetical protein WCF28_04345 [Methanobacterium sp.]
MKYSKDNTLKRSILTLGIGIFHNKKIIEHCAGIWVESGKVQHSNSQYST